MKVLELNTFRRLDLEEGFETVSTGSLAGLVCVRLREKYFAVRDFLSVRSLFRLSFLETDRPAAAAPVVLPIMHMIHVGRSGTTPRMYHCWGVVVGIPLLSFVSCFHAVRCSATDNRGTIFNSYFVRKRLFHSTAIRSVFSRF